MFYKKNRYFIISIVFTFVLFLYAIGQNIILTSASKKELKSISAELESESTNNKYLKSIIEKQKLNLKDKQDFKKKLDMVELKAYDFKNVNDFISNFENFKSRYAGFGKAIYKIDEREKSLSIKMNYTVDYRALRSFIFNIEKTYYFTEFNSLKIIRDKNKVKGIIAFKAYFGADVDEK